VFLLEIDETTMLARLDDRRDCHDWGRIGDTREYLRRKLPDLQDRLRAAGAIPIDAVQPPRPGGRGDPFPDIALETVYFRRGAGLSNNPPTDGRGGFFTVPAPSPPVRRGLSNRPGISPGLRSGGSNSPLPWPGPPNKPLSAPGPPSTPTSSSSSRRSGTANRPMLWRFIRSSAISTCPGCLRP